MTTSVLDIEGTLATLGRTPAVLHELLADVSDTIATRRGTSGAWSAFDVVGHLIDGEETDWVPRARIILMQGPDRRFVPFDRFRHLERNRGRTLAELLDEFAWLREENLETVRAWHLTPRQLALTGEHPELGSVSLRQLLATWVAHDLGHVAQAARALAAPLRDEVGPWLAYLPVLRQPSSGNPS
ncbi:MAG TPA: DinB family protein [Gemmatimonadales bacterium]|nr:DinB family protein [Gemmatimonadales bacterium]